LTLTYYAVATSSSGMHAKAEWQNIVSL